jgi:hypothetical protein
MKVSFDFIQALDERKVVNGAGEIGTRRLLFILRCRLERRETFRFAPGDTELSDSNANGVR